MKPEILNPRKDKKKIEVLKKSKDIKIANFFSDQIEELTKIKSRNLKDTDYIWVYYPWSRTIIKILNKDDYRSVRLSRNKNLITEREQEKFLGQRIGIVGLNVGNPGAICIALEGGAEKMKLADNDVLELSNLNRFGASLGDLGINKAVLSAHQIYEIDPFYNIEVFDKGITEENINMFLAKPKIDLLIEEMDNLKLKIKIREKAKYYKIPVLMVTGNEAGLIIDIERYDIEPDLPILNGYLKEDVMKKISKISSKTTVREKIDLARDFMGKKFLTERLNQSFNLVGKELAGIPQISESSFLRGAVLCYFARQIAVGKEIPSGRYFMQIGDSLN